MLAREPPARFTTQAPSCLSRPSAKPPLVVAREAKSRRSSACFYLSKTTAVSCATVPRLCANCSDESNPRIVLSESQVQRFEFCSDCDECKVLLQSYRGNDRFRNEAPRTQGWSIHVPYSCMVGRFLTWNDYQDVETGHCGFFDDLRARATCAPITLDPAEF